MKQLISYPYSAYSDSVLKNAPLFSSHKIISSLSSNIFFTLDLSFCVWPEIYTPA